MTIKDLYNWAVENGAEDFELVNYYWNGEGNYTEESFFIDYEGKKVATDFEC